MKKLTEREALDLIRATATRSVPNCINLQAIDRILADVPAAATSVSGGAATDELAGGRSPWSATDEWLTHLLSAARKAEKEWADNIVGWHNDSNLQELHNMDETDAAYISAARPSTIIALLARLAASPGSVTSPQNEVALQARAAELRELADGFKGELGSWNPHSLMYCGFMEACKIGAARSLGVAEAGGWISVDEQLPTGGEMVDVATKYIERGADAVTIARYFSAYPSDQQDAYWKGPDDWYDTFEITHWKPRPKHPADAS